MEQKVYASTTQPLSKRRRGYYNRQDKSDLGADFVAPDGGWAWLVCVAAGLSNVGVNEHSSLQFITIPSHPCHRVSCSSRCIRVCSSLASCSASDSSHWACPAAM